MELLEAVKKVLEWYAEDASDNVARRAVLHDLQEAYDNAAEKKRAADGEACRHKNTVRINARDYCDDCHRYLAPPLTQTVRRTLGDHGGG